MRVNTVLIPFNKKWLSISPIKQIVISRRKFRFAVYLGMEIPKIHLLFVLMTLLIFTGCENATSPDVSPVVEEKFFIRGADLSLLPLIEREGTVFYNSDSIPEAMLLTLRKAGVNTVRLRLWKDPEEFDSGYAGVKWFCSRLRSEGFRVMLTVHYSDTWADPGHQAMPHAWEGITRSKLLDSVYNYTKMIADEIKPDFIQIGNEINSGFMFDEGRLSTSPEGFRALIDTAVSAVRRFSPGSRIILHYAGIEWADGFFRSISGVDYDIIGLSFYPLWHGKNVDTLSGVISALNSEFGKEVAIVETSYPFTLGWNDWTNNIIGLEDQLHPGYPATPEGQYSFIKKVFDEVRAAKGGIGVCYWGGEWVAFRGTTSANGSPYENQALFNFNFRALPVIEAFKE